MRIAHVNQDPGITPGGHKGAAVHLDEMRRAFAALGTDVVPIDEPEARATLERLEAEDAGGGLDLVYERYSLRTGAAYSFASAHAVPYVLEVNAPLEEEELRYRGRGAEGERGLVVRGADLVLAVSRGVAEYAVARGAAPDRVLVRANAVDVERFAPRAPGDDLRARLVPPGSFVLGFHGRLRPWHNLPLFVECAARLLDEGRAVHVLFVGEGPFDEVVGARIPAEHHTVLPWVPHAEVGRYVGCFDALPLTYSADAPAYFSPLKLLEAMAAGVVPLIPRHGDLDTIVEHGRNGLHYTAGDARALAAAVRRLIECPEVRRTLAAAARRRALGHTWDGVARDVLERALGGVLP